MLDEPGRVLPQAPVRETVLATRAGFVQRVEPRVVGRGIIEMGGGRRTMEDAVGPGGGVQGLGEGWGAGGGWAAAGDGAGAGCGGG